MSFYNNNEELFSTQKLSAMFNEDDNNVYFPNKSSAKPLVSSINDIMALAYSSILKAGFNSPFLDLKQKNNSVEVLFNGKLIQKLIFNEVDTVDDTVEISNIILKNNPQEKADKVTYIFFHKETFLSNKTALGEYISKLRKVSSNIENLTVKKLRTELLSQSGIYIEEYENKNKILSEDDQLTENLISHHNTFSTQIIYKINNIKEFDYRLEQNNNSVYNSGEYNLEVNLKYAGETPIYAYNPIISVSNYRDLSLEKIANQMDVFVDTLIGQASSYYSERRFLNDEFISERQKNRHFSNMKNSLAINGMAKKLYSISVSEEVSEFADEIKIYKDQNSNGDFLCISSKGTCLGDGQHSTSILNILNLVLNYSEENCFYLKEKYDLDEVILSKHFKLNANKNPYKELRDKIKNKIEASGISFEDFLNFYEKMHLKINWTVAENDKVLSRSIANDNNQKQQEKNDHWINENKNYIEKFLSSYNYYNKSTIQKYSKIQKDATHPLHKFCSTMDLRAIKTPEFSPTVSNETSYSVELNEIYSFMSFVLPTNKHLSPIDHPYANKPDYLKNISKTNLRTVYQSITMMDENLYKVFEEIFNQNKFLKTQTNNAFDNFISFLSNENIGANTKPEKKHQKFMELGEDALKNGYIFQQIPSIILFKDMAEHYFEIFNSSVPDKINQNNFIKLCFTAYVSKIGKGNKNKEYGFNLHSIETIGELIIKDVTNSLHKYYSQEHTVKSDTMKRVYLKEAVKESEILNQLKVLAVDLFEPYVNKINNVAESGVVKYDSNKLKNLKYFSISEAIKEKEVEINDYFLNNFSEQVKINTKKKNKV